MGSRFIMCADKFKKSEEYSKTRNSFEDLGVEEQAVFIVESAVNMIVKSVQKAGDAFSKAFEEMKTDGEHEEEDTSSKSAASSGAGKKATKSKAKSGSAKKPASKASKPKSSSNDKSE